MKYTTKDNYAVTIYTDTYTQVYLVITSPFGYVVTPTSIQVTNVVHGVRVARKVINDYKARIQRFKSRCKQATLISCKYRERVNNA